MAPRVTIVIIDDNSSILAMLSEALQSDDVRILTSSDPEQGLDIIFREHPQIVLTDLIMPGTGGLDIIDRVVAFDPAIDVIVMTGHSAVETAVEAIRKGASDYLTKPLPIAMIRERLARLVNEARRRNRTNDLEAELLQASTFEGMIGRSAALMETSARITRVAPHYRTALIGGETGTGKELAARALHNLSPVSRGRFVVLNCSAVVETLFESELFGHVRGAFTSAVQDKMGLFEYADKGTIFLDEIGDMPLGTQAKLLRTLQNQEVLRVGSLTPRRVDVRVIAATHRDLHKAIAQKQFREDLYYRLSMIEIRVPSLAERKEDLPLLVRHLVEKYARQFGKEIRGLTQRAQIVIARHNWPGNVRELENVIGYACMMVVGETIDVQDLPEQLRASRYVVSPMPVAVPVELNAVDDTALEAHEKRLIAHALATAKGNQSEAARSLRIGRDALRYKIIKHGLDVPGARKAATG